ncbi:DUF2267 domain-containing protein [Streptomyces sp. JJ36]|uniref:DUF2267 domain-containing protein n=1 Tax=Streptomyces sp. JJ36 TaxID=2736645 RepID=UPI001F1ECF61|nr:DUF2267 domain-containing protein [Streptomyces sp. JJ36]MCF6525227.1 DUF2267 domain-containing protein [Streptomyces sp. JJ36]
MPYGEFLATVRERGGYAPDEAERSTEAVVGALGRRLPAGAAEHLGEQLPQRLAELLGDAQARAETWGVHEFVAHVAEASGTDEPTAEEHSRTVLSTLADRISGGELNKVLGRLPSGYAELFGHPELSE